MTTENGLVAATDEHFAWLLGAGAPASVHGVTVAEGGIEAPEVLEMLRGVAARVRAAFPPGAWLIVTNNEVAGLISYMAPPDGRGAVEIGFGIAAGRRRQGLATEAVRELVRISRATPGLTALTAETAAWNVASQRALERAGFVRCHERTDDADGDVIGWRRALG